MIDYEMTRTSRASEQGLYIAAVAYNNDFQVGDRIVAVGGAPVATGDQMREAISGCRAGDVVSVTVLRDGALADIDVTLTESDTSKSNAVPAA